jgi:hypothetical protein
LLPVSVVSLAFSGVLEKVVGHRGYPESGETHPLDVVQMVDYTLVGAAAIDPVRSIARSSGRVIGSGKSVRECVVDGLGSPLSRCCCQSNAGKCYDQDEN